MNGRRWAVAALLATLVFDVWWRGHTLSGTVRDRLGVAPWPVVAEAEPLTCDEAIYAYIGKRIARGDVIYRDLTENKPPMGYWAYALAVAIGGPNETAVRLMPVPLVLLTIALVWSIALRLGGPLAASLSAPVYALMSTDPYLSGNGANMEHSLNLFATAALWLAVRSWPNRSRWPWIFVGVLVGLASLVKQVAVVPMGVFAVALMVRRGHEFRSRMLDAAALLAGFATSWGLAMGLLVAQGAGASAYEDIFRYGRALATDTPPDPLQYSFFVRLFVGNTDPRGLLPWPFGQTLGRAWWATGSWPLWLVSVPAMLGVIASKRGGTNRLVGWWTLAAWVQVAMPRLFWQHYYLLVVPGVAILVGDLFASAVRARWPRGIVVATIVMAATIATLAIQVRDYLLVKPSDVTTRYNGGGQWVVLREVGRELGRRTRGWDAPHLYVWGIQSPVTFYSGLDGVTPQVFLDPLIQAYSNGGHPLVDPRLERTIADLRARKPEFLFIGARPFPALARFIGEEYENAMLTLPLPVNPLWVRRDFARKFAATGDEQP